MARYALIDINSRRVSGVVDADRPESACKIVDFDGGERNRIYDVFAPDSGAHHWAAPGYLVYQAPDNFELTDEGDEDSICAVLAFRRVAIVLTKDAE